MTSRFYYGYDNEDGKCPCGDARCDYYDFGYTLCRPCEKHHRNPECPVDEQGRALKPSGVPWDTER